MNFQNISKFGKLFKRKNEINIPFLGFIPINTEARKLADEGRSIIIEQKDADMSLAIFEIVNKIEKVLST